jgi:hypothetical protein
LSLPFRQNRAFGKLRVSLDAKDSRIRWDRSRTGNLADATP